MCADNCLNHVFEEEKKIRDRKRKELLNSVTLKDDKGNDPFLKIDPLFLPFRYSTNCGIINEPPIKTV